MAGYARGVSSSALPRGGLLLFDGDCGFCTSVARWARRRLPSDVGVTPWQFVPDLGRLGLTVDDVSTAAYWIDERGRGHRGHLAFAEAFRAMGGGWRVLGSAMRTRPLTWLAAVVYDVIARNRHRLLGSTPACRVPAPGDHRG
jgi:predicted DCC family thiol-disulfide oxidoreductase YuxK